MSDDGWVESDEGDLDWDLTEEAGYGAWEPPAHRKLAPFVRRLALWLMLIAILGSVMVVLLQTGRGRLEAQPTPTPVFFTSTVPLADEGAQPEPVLFFARPEPYAPFDARPLSWRGRG